MWQSTKIEYLFSISTHAYLSDYISCFYLCFSFSMYVVKILKITQTNLNAYSCPRCCVLDICYPEAWLVICGSDLCNLFPWSHPNFNVKLELYVSPMWGWVRGLEISSKGVWLPSMEEHKHCWQTWWFCNEYIHSLT